MYALNLIAIAALVSALGGCAATASPEWDSRFGDSTRMLRVQQLIDPAAATRNAQSSKPTDGRTTREAMNRQLESYRAPPPANITNISVGGATP